MFSSNWFEKLAKDNFENIIKPIFKEVDKINYLEIGCFEGASLTYMFENVLTHCESTATVIDPFIFYENQYNVFNENMKPYMNQINLKKGYSQNILPTLTQDFDLIYIDGDHTSEGVFNDAKLSFPLLKKNGIIIFDDYLWRHNGEHTIVTTDDINLLHPNNPFSGINQFLDIHKDKIEIIKQNWQMIIKKI